MDLRLAIKKLRREDVSYADLKQIAKRNKLHVNTLLAIKNGQTDNPRLETAEAIADYFERTT